MSPQIPAPARPLGSRAARAMLATAVLAAATSAAPAAAQTTAPTPAGPGDIAAAATAATTPFPPFESRSLDGSGGESSPMAFNAGDPLEAFTNDFGSSPRCATATASSTRTIRC
jgi:hypothetical protein